MNTLEKFTTLNSGRSWEGDRDVLYMCRLLVSVALAWHLLIPNKQCLGRDACMTRGKNVARDENEKAQERPTETSYRLHDVVTQKKKKVAENNSFATQQNMTRFLSLGWFIYI